MHAFPSSSFRSGVAVLMCALVGFLAESPGLRAADQIAVEQAGDRFVNFVLSEIETTRGAIPAMSRAADAAAQRVVERDGEFLSAGDLSFSLEPVWRAGGIAFAKRYLPDKAAAKAAVESASAEIPFYRTKEFVDDFSVEQAGPNDVVLLGYENEQVEARELIPTCRKLLGDGAFVVFFGSAGAGEKLARELGQPENLATLTHQVPDGGVIEIPGWPEKICSGRSLANRLSLWTFQAEFIAACMRLGKIPGILLSVTYESPQVWNLPLMYEYKFIPAFNVTPVPPGQLGSTYLDHIRDIVASIVPPQRAKLRQAAQWLAEAHLAQRTSYALLIHGLDPVKLPGDPGLFQVYSEGNAYYPQIASVMQPDEVALFVGYNWYPDELAAAVDQARGKQILCFTLVQHQPPRPATYGEVGELEHFTTFDDLPQADNRIYIDLKFAEYNAVLKIPDYPLPALETSAFAEDVVYWHLVADVVELLAAQQ